MVDIQDVSIIGGPGRVSVELDFGAQGIRGSQIFAGVGDPNEIEIGQFPILNDLYIDLQTKNFYQYQSVFTTQEWVPLLNLESNEISVNSSVSFVDGTGELEINLLQFLGVDALSNISAETINTVFSIENVYPCASAIFFKSFENSILYLNIIASQFDGTSWSNLSGNLVVNATINFATVVQQGEDES
jgi:hypothetical protein